MKPMLQIENLNVRVEGEEILHDINLVIPPGEIHAILGPNGGGKTSLMMTIMGFSKYQISSGRILFEGEDITYAPIAERARMGISVAQQRPPTIEGVKLAQVLEFLENKDEKSILLVEQYINTASMETFLPREINAGLSGGEIRRSELLQLIAMRPKFAMLDEPDSGVDVGSMELIGRMINEIYGQDPVHPASRRAGLIITHNGAMLDHIYTETAHVIIDGKLACSGNPRQILESAGEDGYENCAACIRGEYAGMALHGH
ncbi:MAG: ABC transporter ATP-binding protein [Anaerolineae bacterium]|jgi:Fe-S cluster assembly ATP-binding protein|nr:ABC transporter ATP-binding protein [Anaerolineae bacterium]